MKLFNEGMEASVYMMTTVKVIELIYGISFISGKFVRLLDDVIAMPINHAERVIRAVNFKANLHRVLFGFKGLVKTQETGFA